ncbi:fatty acid-binding protein 2-like [Danaus plexippus]|uniref:fatty acid-binding protein 2-like n=1 Tax=Danaus plexippus TaxID=13037 RepID=UPI002AB0A5DB|nr:fatty acid-binding protein 2-like [Danaus plexippus]
MEFLGKTYIKNKDENFKEFLESLGLAEDKVKALLSFDQKNCLKKDGDDYLMVFDNADGEKVLKFKNGVEFDEEITPIVNSKTTFTLDGNVLHQIQNLGTVIINIKRDFSADQLVMTVTTNLWDGTARRYFKRM